MGRIHNTNVRGVPTGQISNTTIPQVSGRGFTVPIYTVDELAYQISDNRLSTILRDYIIHVDTTKYEKTLPWIDHPTFVYPDLTIEHLLVEAVGNTNNVWPLDFQSILEPREGSFEDVAMYILFLSELLNDMGY
jgi:hypothetical protein